MHEIIPLSELTREAGTINLKIHTCTRCGYDIVFTRFIREAGKITGVIKSQNCPGCNSPLWDKPYTKPENRLHFTKKPEEQ